MKESWKGKATDGSLPEGWREVRIPPHLLVRIPPRLRSQALRRPPTNSAEYHRWRRLLHRYSIDPRSTQDRRSKEEWRAYWREKYRERNPDKGAQILNRLAADLETALVERRALCHRCFLLLQDVAYGKVSMPVALETWNTIQEQADALALKSLSDVEKARDGRRWAGIKPQAIAPDDREGEGNLGDPTDSGAAD